jgi:hypothetical protein
MNRFNAFLLGACLGAVAGGVLAFVLLFFLAGAVQMLPLKTRSLSSVMSLGFTIQIVSVAGCTLWGGLRSLRAYEERPFGPVGRGAGAGTLFGMAAGLLYMGVALMLMRSAASPPPVFTDFVSPWMMLLAALPAVISGGILGAGFGAVVGLVMGRGDAGEVPASVRRAHASVSPEWIGTDPDARPYGQASYTTEPVYSEPASRVHARGRSIPDDDVEEVRILVEETLEPAVLEHPGEIEWDELEHPGPRTLVLRGHVLGTSIGIRASALRRPPGSQGYGTPGLGVHAVFQMPQPAPRPMGRRLQPEWLYEVGVRRDLADRLAGGPEGFTDDLDDPGRPACSDPDLGIHYTADLNAHDRVGGRSADRSGAPCYTVVSAELCGQAASPPHL